MMRVFQGAHLQIVRGANIVVWAQHKAGAFPRKECFQRLDLSGLWALPGDHVVQAEEEERIDIVQHTLIQR
jgi:hypothetical protein